MKFSPSFIVAVYTIYMVIILFSATPNQACEQSCRDGISLAFCNSYVQEWDPLFDTFGTNLIKNLYTGYNNSDDNNDQVENTVNTAVLNQIKKLKVDFTKSCQEIVQDSIFLHEPRFKGQCQDPKRVTQPKRGVNWTLTDCQNQDYVCGNPPSICHFMDKYVKPRNVKSLKEAFISRTSTDGDFTSSITNIADLTVINSGAFGKDQTRVNTFMKTVTANLRAGLDQFAVDFNDKFCFTQSNSTTSCDKYDDRIKSLLLSFP